MKYGSSFNLLSEDKIKSVITTKLLAKKIYAFWSISTTNDFAYQRALQGENEGTLVIAEQQERGKGRMARAWDSPFNKGLWFSIILQPELPASKAGLIPYIAGVSVAEAVEDHLNLQLDMKWPNDILLNGKKFCGILSEVEFHNGNVKFIILGIGVNVNHKQGEWPEEFRDKTTSLRIESGKRIDRAEFLAKILSQLEYNYDNTKNNGFDEVMDKWKQRCSKFKKNIVIIQNDNTFEGTFHDLDEEGCLMLKTKPGEIKKIVAGDIAS